MGVEGALLDLAVGPSLLRQEALKKAGQSQLAPMRVRGLVDTGASLTVIDTRIIAALQLAPTGMADVITATTGTIPTQLHQFDVQMSIMHPVMAYSFHVLPVIAAELSFQGFDVLIGRDMLADCLLLYDGRDRRFSLAF